MLTRSVSAEGRSRAFAGGRSVPVSLLTYLADDLVAVHGQSDQQQLLKPGRQRESLDKYAGGGARRGARPTTSGAYGRHRKVHRGAHDADHAGAGPRRRGRGAAGGPAPRSRSSTRWRARRPRCAPRRSGWPTPTRCTPPRPTAHEALLGDPTAGNDGADAVTLLGHARRALEAVRRHDAEIDGVAGRLSEAAYLVSEVAGELASYIQCDRRRPGPARRRPGAPRRAGPGHPPLRPGGVSAHVNGAPARRAARPA